MRAQKVAAACAYHIPNCKNIHAIMPFCAGNRQTLPAFLCMQGKANAKGGYTSLHTLPTCQKNYFA